MARIRHLLAPARFNTAIGPGKAAAPARLCRSYWACRMGYRDAFEPEQAVMDARRPDLSFVLPAHNEAQNVAAMAAALARVAAPLGSHEIVFVDDGSTD